MIPVQFYLIVSAVMLFAGIYGFITRRNLLAILISIELVLYPGALEGLFFALFAIAVAAAETAVAIAIIINIYRNIRNIEVKKLNELKD